jgi:hypothetical protein
MSRKKRLSADAGPAARINTRDRGKKGYSNLIGEMRYLREIDATVWDGRSEKRSLTRFASIPWTRASRESV